ncbi:DUF4185 domain-containing protein [Cohnella sp. REN36]|uniref:DUF4185 domain-containing protein n=1 Tax=Cohnella sp. REN36 TaxID=2887347 RepID=UPI001D14637E|nr:DUF4185 domain-containing protein [Cohnella sp. REN36]MCC3375673.1 DUF4185 domain-containing protein [Cohnella sp. REN36]
MKKRGFRFGAIGLAAFLLLLAACTEETRPAEDGIVVPPESEFFATVAVEPASTYPTFSDGDLWPAAWSDDDALYAANGDGAGFDFGAEFADIVVNRITGSPWDGSLDGERLAAGDAVGRVWSDPARYNRKPTGIVSVNGVLYLAVQDLNKDEASGDIFNEAPAATIYKSTDKGRTWTAGPDAPMFRDHAFTTIMFLDYGRDGADNRFDDYVYAYGLDNNWRDSFNGKVEDPTRLYLARMPKDGVQDAKTWQYYSGDLNGKAKWTKPGDLAGRRPVLRDDRRVYADRLTEGLGDMSVLSQGSIVYNRPLNRYLYTSWTEFTFEFYEAPKPWGPWKRFYSADFGEYPWTSDHNGGYATVIPSKFISADGREMWMNANTFVGGAKNYDFSLRKLKVTPYRKTKPANGKSDANLALPAYDPDVAPCARTMGNGGAALLNDGDNGASVDSRNGERKTEDWWGYVWPRAYRMNKVAFTNGDTSPSGGWFDDLRVQVRQSFRWVDVSGAAISPAYPASEQAGGRTYTIAFDEIAGDGIRIVGKPGGPDAYTSVAELEVYYADSGSEDK